MQFVLAQLFTFFLNPKTIGVLRPVPRLPKVCNCGDVGARFETDGVFYAGGTTNAAAEAFHPVDDGFFV